MGELLVQMAWGVPAVGAILAFSWSCAKRTEQMAEMVEAFDQYTEARTAEGRAGPQFMTPDPSASVTAAEHPLHPSRRDPGGPCPTRGPCRAPEVTTADRRLARLRR